QTLQRTLVPTTIVLVMSETLGSVWAAEHKIERGLFPTMFEFAHASTDAGFAKAGMQVFLLSRFAYPTLLSFAALALIAVAYRRASRRFAVPGPRRVSVTMLLAAAAVALGCFGFHRASPLLFASVPNWRAIESPLHVFTSFGVERENVRLGALALFQKLALPPPERGAGSALLGLPTDAGDRLSQVHDTSQCLPHPAAVPVAPPGPAPKERKGGYHHALHTTLDQLSQALFEGRKGPVRVWVLALESLRADDVHALHPRAHSNIAPFVTSLYERARSGGTDVVVAEHMMQAGCRTSQGLAAMTCGMGTMPYGLSAARDLGLLPLRCLPDVLADASFRTAFYYGSNPSFDNMLAFLNYHGFDRIKAEKDYVEEVPHQGWSVPDAIVFAQAFEDSEREPRSQSQLNFAMSLTNHFPFKRPEDFPAVVGDRVAEAVNGSDVGADDVARLETLSYTDWAFEQLVSRIGAAESAGDTFIVAAADHSTTDYFLWREDGAMGAERDRATTQIPFMVVFPKPFLARAAHPARARQLVGRLNALLADTALSQNDIPRFVLALLMHSEPLGTLPEEWRWHNLGGQRLSPSFEVPGHPDAVTIGLDPTLRICVANEEGVFKRTEESSKLTLDVESAMQQGPTLRPAAAVFASMLQGYGKHCWEAKTIRRE
ncbi:MAG: sulfatase-like hydrolase/transferase, partial [Myxococcota bacterium]